MNTTIYLVRHAESKPDFNLKEKGWTLSPKGIIQAEELVKKLLEFEIDCIYSSPYKRAVETIIPFSKSLNMEINILENLREKKLTDGYSDNWIALSKKSWQDFDFKLKNCESSNECQKRIKNCIDLITLNNLGNNIIISTHGNALALFINSIDENFSYQNWLKMENPAIFKVTYHNRGKNYKSWFKIV